jgi:hypothetical protein
MGIWEFEASPVAFAGMEEMIRLEYIPSGSLLVLPNNRKASPRRFWMDMMPGWAFLKPDLVAYLQSSK